MVRISIQPSETYAGDVWYVIKGSEEERRRHFEEVKAAGLEKHIKEVVRGLHVDWLESDELAVRTAKRSLTEELFMHRYKDKIEYSRVRGPTMTDGHGRIRFGPYDGMDIGLAEKADLMHDAGALWLANNPGRGFTLP